jgi:hypothetical protein
MMARLQTFFGLLIGASLFGACTVMPLRSDYTWADSYTRSAEERGWRLVHTSRNYNDLSRPWTIITPPPVGLFFIEPSSVSRLPDGSRSVRTLTAHRTQPPIEEFEGIDFYDCRNRRFAFQRSRAGSSASTEANLEWRPVDRPGDPDTPSAALLAAVCSPS